MPLLVPKPAVVDRGLEAAKLSAHGAFVHGSPVHVQPPPGQIRRFGRPLILNCSHHDAPQQIWRAHRPIIVIPNSRSAALLPQSARCYARRRTGSFSMHKIAVAVMLALIAAPALAQDHVQQYGEQPQEKTPSQKADDNRAERAYQRSLNNVPDQKPVDPWGTARGGDASKKPAKPAVKQSSKAKSGSNPN
jgi:hypothetical protein